MGKLRKNMSWGAGFGFLLLLTIGTLLVIDGVMNVSWIDFGSGFGLGLTIIVATLFATGYWVLTLFSKN